MVNGNFRLIYEDGNCGVYFVVKVCYWIFQLLGCEQVVMGVIDVNGYIVNVDSQKQGYFLLISVRLIVLVILMKVFMLLCFMLQVWDYDLQQWVEFDLKLVSKLVYGGRNELSIGINVIMMVLVVCELLLQFYLCVLFQMQVNNMLIVSVLYEVVMCNKDGDEVVGLDVVCKLVKGSIGKDGMILWIICNQLLKFKFMLLGSKFGCNIELFVLLIKGQQVIKYVFGLKSQIVFIEFKDGWIVIIQGKVSVLVVFNLQVEEMLLLGLKEWEEFEVLSGIIENMMVGLYCVCDKFILVFQGCSLEEVKVVEKVLGIVEDDVVKMLNDKFDKLIELQELVMFEIYDKGCMMGNGGVKDCMGMCCCYIFKVKYEDFKW